MSDKCATKRKNEKFFRERKKRDQMRKLVNFVHFLLLIQFQKHLFQKKRFTHWRFKLSLFDEKKLECDSLLRQFENIEKLYKSVKQIETKSRKDFCYNLLYFYTSFSLNGN